MKDCNASLWYWVVIWNLTWYDLSSKSRCVNLSICMMFTWVNMKMWPLFLDRGNSYTSVEPRSDYFGLEGFSIFGSWISNHFLTFDYPLRCHPPPFIPCSITEPTHHWNVRQFPCDSPLFICTCPSLKLTGCEEHDGLEAGIFSRVDLQGLQLLHLLLEDADVVHEGYHALRRHGWGVQAGRCEQRSHMKWHGALGCVEDKELAPWHTQQCHLQNRQDRVIMTGRNYCHSL